MMEINIEEIKGLNRDDAGLFILEGNIFETAAKVFPIYCNYETHFNNKGEYLDIIHQLRILQETLNKDYTLEIVTYF